MVGMVPKVGTPENCSTSSDDCQPPNPKRSRRKASPAPSMSPRASASRPLLTGLGPSRAYGSGARETTFMAATEAIPLAPDPSRAKTPAAPFATERASSELALV